MAFFIPATSTFTAAQADRESLRYWQLMIDTDDDDSLDDVTSDLENNKLSGGCNANGFSQWRATLKNDAGTYSAGDLAGAICEVRAKVGAAEYITIFTGFVSAEGCKRVQDNKAHDVVVVEMEGRDKHIAMTRRVDPKVLVNYKICDTVSTSGSIMHELAGYMDVTAANMAVSTINYTKPYLPLYGRQTAWVEMRKMADQYLGVMYFRYDGDLLFASRFADSYVGPSSEFTFDLTNIIDLESIGAPIQSNKVSTEYLTYEALDADSIIYRNTDNWDKATQKCAISVAGHAYWPGPGATDIGILNYKDPDTGDRYPIAVTVSTPDLGAANAGTAIESTGGDLTLESFNGSTTSTNQRPDASEIILLNDSSVACTISKFEIYGTPLSVQSKRLVEDRESGLEEWEYIEKRIPGEYAVSDAQAHITTQWWKDFGGTQRTAYRGIVDWVPQIAKGALVTLNPPGEVSLACFVESFEHPAANGPLTKQVTTVRLVERFAFVPTGTARVWHDAYGRQAPVLIVVESSEAVRQGGMYRCNGADDDVEIQEAIDLVIARGSGRVELTEGKFYTTAAITGASNIILSGRGAGTIIEKNGNFYAVSCIGGSGTEKNNFEIRDLKLTRDSGDTNIIELLYLKYADAVILDKVTIEDSYGDGGLIEYCENVKLINCIVNGSEVNGVILKQVLQAAILSCVITACGGTGLQLITDDATNIIDRGDCEASVSAMISGETVPLTNSATWSRSDEQAYLGTYSWKMLSDDGGLAVVLLVDNENIADLHGAVPGKYYRLVCQVYCPGGVSDALNFQIQMGYYQEAAWHATAVNNVANIYDEWQEIQVAFQLPSNAVAFFIRLMMVASTTNDYIYIDEVYLYESDISGDSCSIVDTTVKDCLGDGINLISHQGKLVNNITTNNWRSGIKVMGSRNMLMSNLSYDNGQLIDRGNCESTTSAMIFGETVPTLSNALWARSDTQAYEGTYSWKFTKDVAAGTQAYVVLCDNENTNDMHGFIASKEYKFTVKIYIPLGTILGSEIELWIYDYDSVVGWLRTRQAAANTYDEWQEVTVTRTIRSVAIATTIYFAVAVTAEDAELFYVDNIRLQPLGIHNEHLQNFYDLGTRTQKSGNSWQ